jgi:tetratricopeptide (TPR) repeat protein
MKGHGKGSPSWLLAISLLFVFLLTNTNLAAAQLADADVLITQATLAYDDQEYDKALELLDRVLAIDPANARAHYYKGLVHLAQQKPDLAVSELELARQSRPTDLFIRYQLGVAYFLLKDYEKAEPLLSDVYAEQPTLESLGFYVGFLRYRHKAYPEALEAFSKTRTADPNIRQLNAFYKGLTLGTLGLSEQAVAELDEALTTQSAEPFSEPTLRLQQALTAARSTERRLRAEMTLGGYYSDNVAVNPDPSSDPTAEAIRSRTTTSPGLLASLHGEYSWYRKGPVEATASYSFFQTVNLNDGLSKFNIEDHQVGLASYYRGALANMPYQVGLSYAYDYLLLGQAAFMSRHTPILSGTLIESARHMTTGLFRFQDKTFYRDADATQRFPGDQRDALNWMGGFTHTMRFQDDRHLLSVGYQYDVEDAKGSNFSYSGNRLLLGALYTLPWGDTRLRYDYTVHWRDYRSFNSTFPSTAPGTIRRDDTEQIHFARVEKPLPHNFTVSFQYQRIQNDSNLAVYAYTQNVWYLLTTWTY